MLNFQNIANEIVNENNLKIHSKIDYAINVYLDKLLSNLSIEKNKKIIEKHAGGCFNASKYFKNIVGHEFKIDYNDEQGYYVALAYASIFNRVYQLVTEKIQ